MENTAGTMPNMVRDTALHCEPITEECCTQHYNKRDARIGYSQMIFNEYPQLADVCLAFFKYPMCSYAVRVDNRIIKKTLEQFRKEAIESGLDSHDLRWQYTMDHRQHCMATTEAICKLVKKTIRKLEKLCAEGDLRSKRTLRALNLYHVKTSQKPFQRNEPHLVISAFQHVYELYGSEYDALFAKIRKPDSDPALFNWPMLFECYHHTEILLAYYKGLRNEEAENTPFRKKVENEEMLRDLIERNRGERGTRIRHSVAARCAAKMIALTLDALKRYKSEDTREDGERWYRALDQHYISPVPISEQGREEWNNSWKASYEMRDNALRAYSIMLWGYYTVNSLDVLEDAARRSRKKKSVKR